MGWASGSYLCEGIWKDIKKYIPKDKQEKVSAKLCKHFVDNDADDFEFKKGSPYYNYLKLYEPDYFKEITEEE